jgi:hypothetical protein
VRSNGAPAFGSWVRFDESSSGDGDSKFLFHLNLRPPPEYREVFSFNAPTPRPLQHSIIILLYFWL